MTTQTSTSLRFALVLTFCGGFLDAYTFIARGGVFANTQTGNVILLSVELSNGHWYAASEHLWPVLAFVAGVSTGALIKSEHAHHWAEHPMRWAVALQALVLIAVGFVPDTAPNSVVNIPIAFIAAMQMGLFRTIGDLAYLPIATTGNMMRLTEAGYRAFVERQRDQYRAVRVYAALVGCFASGALVGAIATHAWYVHAVWIPAGLLVVMLVLFVVDEIEFSSRRGRV